VESLPEVLSFSPEEIRREILTGTVEVQDELVPDDDDDDIIYRTRAKSSLSVVITIGNGVDESKSGGSKQGPRGKRRKRRTEGVAEAEPDEQESDAQSDMDES
jgi:ribonuclease P/MRP protein subunit RPP20